MPVMPAGAAVRSSCGAGGRRGCASSATAGAEHNLHLSRRGRSSKIQACTVRLQCIIGNLQDASVWCGDGAGEGPLTRRDDPGSWETEQAEARQIR